MRTSTNEIVPGADFVWENSRHGAGGWATICVPSRNTAGNIKALMGCDTQGLRIKDVTADPVGMTNAMTSANTPAGTVAASDTLPSVFACDWAGNSNTNYFAVTDSKVLYFNGTTHVDITPSGGISTAPGRSEYRVVQQKCASDPLNGNVFAFCAASAGWKYSLNATNATPTWVTPNWIAVPTHPTTGAQTPDIPGSKFGQIAWDATSARVGAAGQERYGKVALTSHGTGIYLSTDGLVTGAKISPASPHALDGTGWIGFIGGVLYAIAADLNDWRNNAQNNLWKYSGTGTTWTQLTATAPQKYFGAVADPRTAGAMILSHISGGNMTYTSNPNTPSAYKDFLGGVDAGLLNQMKTRARPFISGTYRNNGGGGAPGPMAVVGPFLYYLLGYGPVRTPIASFPTAGAAYTPNYSTVWPDWEEDAAGYEAIVGQSAVWSASALVCLAQDVGTTLFHDTKSGHDATYSEFPGSSLTNGIGCSRGVSDLNFIVTGALKNGPHFGYSTDGRNFKKMANQPSASLGTGDISPGGAVVAGPTPASKWCQYFPTYNGRPIYTDDLGVTAWKNLAFYKTASGTGSPVDTSYTYNGFDGGVPYYDNHWPCVADPNNPGVYYALNIGGALPTDGSPGQTFENDPAGNAGLYKMDVNVEPGVYRRVKSGRLIMWGNGGRYTLYMAITKDGHLIIMPNVLSGPGTGNYTIDVNLADFTVRQITSVYNLSAFDVGPALYPGGPQGMWAAGLYNGTYGLWLSFDRFQTAPWGPGGTPKNFNYRTPQGGAIKCLAAHPTIFGLLGAALDAGHARGRLQVA